MQLKNEKEWLRGGVKEMKYKVVNKTVYNYRNLSHQETETVISLQKK